MKKLMSVMTAMLLVIGFTMSATAAEMDVTCENCPKAQDPGIIEPGAVTTNQFGTFGGCYPFEYESGDGYCDDTMRTTPFAGGIDKANRIIFTLCDCTSGTFNTDDPIPVRMTVLTDGVYWGWAGIDTTLSGGVPNNTIGTSLNAIVQAVSCPVDFPAGGNQRITSATYPSSGPFEDIHYTFQLEDGTQYRTTILAGTAVAPVSSVVLDNAGSPIGLWTGAATEYNNYDMSAPPTSCMLTADERIKVITASNIYTMQPTDITNNLQKFQIDLPFLRYDANEINLGDSVTVLIEYGKVALCGPCFACECQRTIGVLGACPTTGTECMYFPFVFTDMAPWDTGIVISNLSNTGGNMPAGASYVQIADMQAVFTYIDNTGAEFTYTKSDFDSTVWAFMMGAFAANLSGTPAAGNGWLLVNTNFSVDGYQFVTNGQFGGSTEPRGCCALGLCH